MSTASTNLNLRKACPVVLIAAHPDDEVIGAGAQLAYWNNLSIIYLTDGSPRNLKDARAAGFCSRTDYAQARRRELEEALNLLASQRTCSGRQLAFKTASSAAAHSPVRVFELGVVDQETGFHLTELSCALAQHLRCLAPQVVVTHPYEGGHPDHDSAAFAVHAACSLLRFGRQYAPKIVEMTSYHSRGGAFTTGEFLPNSASSILSCRLTPTEARLKQELFDCFRTQARVLQAFQTDYESFRFAPNYNFAEAPHKGLLYYESFDCGMSGKHWRHLAQTAKAKLRLRRDSSPSRTAVSANRSNSAPVGRPFSSPSPNASFPFHNLVIR